MTASPPHPVAARPSSTLTQFYLAYEWLARRQLLACTAVLFLTLGIRAALLPWLPVPLPAIHDEFSYLLAADTFASGRVTNPPHTMWRHFETFHELMQPTYASKYPPLQGLVLAFGQKLFGPPWAGVYLSMGLLCAAVCWMLQGWLTLNLALLGALLFLLRVGIFSYWMNSYWGGAVAGIGGSLVLGALPRIWRGHASHLITFALGLAILMHSRPWEGAVLALAAMGVLAWTVRPTAPGQTGSRSRTGLVRSAVAGAALLLVSLGAMAYVDFRVTGSPLTMPHALYDKQYVIAPNFAFLSLQPEPLYRHAAIRDLYTRWHVGVWRLAHDNAIDGVLTKVSIIYDFFFGFWPLLIPPLLWPYRLKTIEERAAVLILVIFLGVAIFPLSGLEVHYAAPVAGLLYVRFLQTLSRLHAWRPTGRPFGTAAAVFFATLVACQFGLNLSSTLRGETTARPFAIARNAVVQLLARTPGSQLVLVRYAAGHNPLEEWDWNRADIDGSLTVWARAMESETDPANDQELIEYYRQRQPSRQVWMLDADQTPPRLSHYSDAPNSEKETRR